jgi:hypothetical protein
MADNDTAYFAVRHSGEDGSERFYVTKTIATYPATPPAGASPELTATINALGGLLAGKVAVPISADLIGPEGQLIG